MPASIQCEEEHSFIPTLPRYNYLIEKTCLEIGVYVPANAPWGPNNFINRDGTKMGIKKWGFVSFIIGGTREPGPGGGEEKATIMCKQGIEYTWHDVGPTTVRHLLCKRPAIPQPKKVSPALIKNDEGRNGSYVCPAGFDLGNVCGGHFCYRVVSVPDAKNRMIDDNFCAEFDRDAMPAVIKCKEENDLIVTLSDNEDIAISNGIAIGLYIPATKPWNPNNFVTYDGSKIEYLNWGIFDSAEGPYKEPNGFLNGYPERIVNYVKFPSTLEIFLN
uniref:C-type lectin domain-containing protein n=1 Tax=Panagrolaimus superbus TaxID=310955 RepID=A0A914YV65_9BILA